MKQEKLPGFSIKDFGFYLLSTNKTGWISACEPVPFSSSQVVRSTMVKSEKLAETDVKVVLKDERIVFPAEKTESGFEFSNLPKGKEAILVGLRYENGIAAVAIKEFVIKEDVNINLHYKTVTRRDLKNKLRAIGVTRYE